MHNFQGRVRKLEPHTFVRDSSPEGAQTNIGSLTTDRPELHFGGSDIGVCILSQLYWLLVNNGAGEFLGLQASK